MHQQNFQQNLNKPVWKPSWPAVLGGVSRMRAVRRQQPEDRARKVPTSAAVFGSAAGETACGCGPTDARAGAFWAASEQR